MERKIRIAEYALYSICLIGCIACFCGYSLFGLACATAAGIGMVTVIFLERCYPEK